MPETSPGGSRDNVKHSVRDNILTITIDLTVKGEPSASGKSLVIASTGGNQSIALPDGSSITLGVNCYRKK